MEITENRDTPEFGAELMERLCPFPRDRFLVLQQLLNSISIAQQSSNEVWAITPFADGFRLNVGPVEVMTFKVISMNWPYPEATESTDRVPDLFEVRLLLHGEVTSDFSKFIEEDQNTHRLFPSSYKSVPTPQSFYAGLGEIVDGALSEDSFRKIKTALTLLTSRHASFIQYAAHTPSGKIRQTSNLRRFHSQGLYLYAQSLVREGSPVAFEGLTDGTVAEDGNWSFQEELPPNETLVEGASFTVQVSAFKRNQDARRKCVEHFGTGCVVCGFSFGAMYGRIASDYVHVHHLKPLSSIGKEYVIDPIKDLRPVCANCHSVIHLRQPPYSIDEVKHMLNRPTEGG